MEKTVPLLFETIDVKTIGEIITQVETGLTRGQMVGIDLRYTAWRMIMHVYNQFQTLHPNTLRGIILGTRDEFNSPLSEEFGPISMFYHNISNSTVNGVMDATELSELGTYDLAIVDECQDICRQSCIDIMANAIKLVKPGGKVYSRSIVRYIARTHYLKQPEKYSVEYKPIKAGIDKLLRRRNDIASELKLLQSQYKLKEIDTNTYTKKVQVSRTMLGIAQDMLNTQMVAIQRIEDDFIMDMVGRFMVRNPTVVNVITSELDALHTRIGHTAGTYELLAKFIDYIVLVKPGIN
jgi:hypothetical protein